MNVSRLLLLCVLATLVSCGKGSSSSSGGGPAAPLGTLVFVVHPSNAGTGQAITPSITVEIQTLGGAVMTGASNMVTLGIGTNPSGGTIGGTISGFPAAGVVTFSNITINLAGVGYTLNASSSNFNTGTSNAFDIVPFATQLQITTQPTTVAPYQAFNVVVELQDPGGNVVTTATNAVTLTIGGAPADLILHSSGLSSGNTLEIIDTSTPAVVRTLAPNVAPNEAMSMVWDATLGLVRCADLDGQFMLIDPGTADVGIYGNTATAISYIKGMAFNGMGAIRAVNSGATDTYTVNLGTGVATSLGTTLTLSGATVNFMNGLARHPSTGVFYGVMNADVFTPRGLVTINMGTGVCTTIADFADFVAGLTFGSNGTLYAVTGNASATPETLFTVNTTTGAMTTFLDVSTGGSDGEAIVYTPRRLGGTRTVNAVAGIATFTNMHIDQLGAGYTITASAAGLTSDVSSTIGVTGAVTPTATVGFSTASSSVAEDVGTGFATITVTLSAVQTHNVPVMITIDLATSTAGGGGDDVTTPLAFQVMIPAGSTSVSFNVPIVDDGSVEGDETLEFTLVAANMSAGITGSTHTLTITNDD